MYSTQKGVDSTEADALSRLVHLPKKGEEPLELSDVEAASRSQEEDAQLPADTYQTTKSGAAYHPV